jgi:NAD(P)-dependent dehydrogenase (short-subunit alcohol dehydrogenase family)
MPSHLQTPSITTLSLLTGAALLTGAYVLRCRQRPCHTAEDLNRNALAKGSEVVEIYRERIPKKVVIITGATSGLGRHAAILLGEAGAHLILAVRNVKEGERVKNEIELAGPSNIQVWELDLTRFESVRQFAKKFRETYPMPMMLAGLVNNAGVYGAKGQTVDDFQITWQTNTLAPALLTELLLPAMTKDARVVNVSSEMEKMVWRIKGQCPPTSNGSGTFDYALSKACQVLHAHELALRFQKESPDRRAFAIEPGLVKTRIVRHAGELGRWINYKLLGPFLRDVDQGCSTLLFCLLAPEQDLERGAKTNDVPCYYYANCAPRQPTRCCCSLEEVQAQAELFATSWETKN